MRILAKSGYNYFRKHTLQAALSVIGIALGVALIVSIDIANSSSSRSFVQSMEMITGKATHEIKGSVQGVPDSVYIKLKLSSDFKIAPITEDYIFTGTDFKKSIKLFGIDILSERGFRSFTELSSNDKNRINFSVPDLISVPNSIIISDKTARSLGKSQGDTIRVQHRSSVFELVIMGIVSRAKTKNDDPLYNLIITDISSAQNVLGMKNHLSRIELILKDENEVNKIASQLPIGVYLQKAGANRDVNQSMTEAFQTNLTAMSLLALIVGMFLIYNTMTFSVIQRRIHIGLLRSIGVTKSEIFAIILKESMILGFIGIILGTAIGIYLGKFIILLVTQSINDLYYTVKVNSVEIEPLNILKGVITGLGATILAALKPAKDAADSPIRVVLQRSSLEINIRKKAKRLFFGGLLLIVLGVFLLLIPSKSIIFTYTGIIPIILGFSLTTPMFLTVYIKLIRPLAGKLFGTIGSMSASGIIANMSRTTVAVAALAIAVSSAVGVGTMVTSFRQTVSDWLQVTLRADLYVSVQSLVARHNDQTFEPWIARTIYQMPEVKGMNLYKELQIRKDNKLYHLLASEVQRTSFKSFISKSEESESSLFNHFENDNVVIISEPYAYKNNLEIGDSISIPSDIGQVKFRIGAIYTDFSTDIGLIVLSQRTYRKYWNDSLLSGLAISLKDPEQLNIVMNKIRKLNNDKTRLIIRSNKTLLDNSMEIFDRSFLITNVLQILAIIIAFIGILSSLMALQIERIKEISVLRAIGFIPAQIRRLVFYQTGIIGLAAGLLSVPLGNVLAYILIFTINKRSFGWTLNFEFNPMLIVQALLVSVIAAILAGVYPAYKMSKVNPAQSIRNE